MKEESRLDASICDRPRGFVVDDPGDDIVVCHIVQDITGQTHQTQVRRRLLLCVCVGRWCVGVCVCGRRLL